MAEYYGFRLDVGVSVCPFVDENLSKYGWIFTRLGVFIDIVHIYFFFIIIYLTE